MKETNLNNIKEKKMERENLPDILHEILKDLGGRASMMDVFKNFWKKYKGELRESDDIFYTWNYDIRWAATELRKRRIMKPASTKENTHGQNISPKGIWELY